MKICFIAPQIWPYFNSEYSDKDPHTAGGAERQIHLLSQELAKNHEVHIVTGDYGQKDTVSVSGVTLHASYQPGEDSQLRKVRQLDSKLSKINPNVTIVRGNPTLAAVTSIISTIRGRKFVYHVANDIDVPDTLLHPKSLPIVLADLVIAQSSTQSEGLKIFDANTTTIPNGYPKPEGSICDMNNNGEYFLWVGRLHKKQKQPGVFIDLAENCPGESFVMVGPPSDDDTFHNSLMEKISSLDNIRYDGYVDPSNIDEYYTCAKALVNTSAYEGFPNTFLEAWRYGTPVISYAVDPNRFLETNHLTFANSNISELISIVEQLSSDFTMRDNIGKECKKSFSNKYTIESTSSKLEEELRRL